MDISKYDIHASKKKAEEWDWLTFLLSWHEKEYERRYTLEGVVATPIGLLTGAFALMFLCGTQFDYKDGNPLITVAFVVPLLISLVLALRSSKHVYQSYAVVKNGAYTGIPDAKALRTHMDKLAAHYKEHAPEEDATQKFKEYFIDTLSEQLTTNVINNDERTRDIQKAKPHLRNSLLALLCTLPAFFCNQLTKPDPTYHVTLTNPPSMSKESASPAPKIVPAAPPAPKVTPPLPPHPPKERRIEGKTSEK